MASTARIATERKGGRPMRIDVRPGGRQVGRYSEVSFNASATFGAANGRRQLSVDRKVSPAANWLVVFSVYRKSNFRHARISSRTTTLPSIQAISLRSERRIRRNRGSGRCGTPKVSGASSFKRRWPHMDVRSQSPNGCCSRRH